MKSPGILLIMISLFNLIKNEKTSKSIDNDYIVPRIENATLKIESSLNCPCLGSYPPCCSQEFHTYQCDCAPKPSCSGCPDETMIVSLHDNMLKLAMKDALNQQAFAQKAKMQMDLFQKAQEYAKEAGIQEMKAKQSANSLNEATRKAQYARSLMFQTAAQVRNMAEQAIRAMAPMKCIGVTCAVPMNPVTTITSYPSVSSDSSIDDSLESNMFSSQTNLRGYS